MIDGSQYDITVLIPAIRQNRWVALYDSLKLACKKHSWQLVLVSPFDLPDEMKELDNVKLVPEFGQVSRAVQRGMTYVDGKLVFLTVDDAVFVEDSLDMAIQDYLLQCTYDDALNVRYSEGGDIQPVSYYVAYNHAPLRLAGIDPRWQIAPQFIMDPNKFIALGGFDCQFEYINEAVHDFMFRLQKDEGKIVHSTTHCCVATWYPNTTGDHEPIHNAQTRHDWPIFLEMYQRPNSRIVIDFENWTQAPEIWTRRFSKGLAGSYQELVQNEGYSI